jgi:hypothetical protein
MSQFLFRRRRIATAVTVAFALTGIAAATVPAAASAKGSKPLTKKQVIALIKQYSKPGKTGPKGATGNPGPSWTLTSSSGLSLVNDGLSVNPGPGLAVNSSNQLQLNSGIVNVQCPFYEDMYGVSAASLRCDYPVNLRLASGGFAQDASNIGAGVGIDTTSFSPVASTTAFSPSTASYYVNATVDLQLTGSGDVVFCQLTDGTTVEQTDAIELTGYGDLELQGDISDVASGSSLGVQCKSETSGDSPGAQGTIVAFPLG